MKIPFLFYTTFLFFISNISPKYQFSDELESEIVSLIQSLEPTNISNPIQIFPYLHIKLSNISISILPEWGYIHYNTIDYLGFKIYFMFDLLIYHFNTNEDGSYSNTTCITLSHPSLIGMLDLYLSSFSIDESIGWVNFFRGTVYEREVSFSDMSDYELYSELIGYERNHSVIINALDAHAMKMIKEVLMRYPKCVFQEMFEETWEIAKRNRHLNLTYRECEVVQELKFLSYRYDNVERETERFVFHDVTFVVNVSYENGNVEESNVYFEHVFVGFSQFHSDIGKYTGVYCLGEMVKSELFNSYREIKINK